MEPQALKLCMAEAECDYCGDAVPAAELRAHQRECGGGDCSPRLMTTLPPAPTPSPSALATPSPGQADAGASLCDVAATCDLLAASQWEDAEPEPEPVAKCGNDKCRALVTAWAPVCSGCRAELCDGQCEACTRVRYRSLALDVCVLLRMCRQLRTPLSLLLACSVHGMRTGCALSCRVR